MQNFADFSSDKSVHSHGCASQRQGFFAPRFSHVLQGLLRARHGSVNGDFLPLIEKRRRRGAILFLPLDKSPATPGSVRPTGREFQRINFVDADELVDVNIHKEEHSGLLSSR